MIKIHKKNNMIAIFFSLLEKAIIIANRKFPYRDEDIFHLSLHNPDNWINLDEK